MFVLEFFATTTTTATTTATTIITLINQINSKTTYVLTQQTNNQSKDS